MNVFKYN